MPANTSNTDTTGNDAAARALQREQAAAPGEAPVKQHTPREQGLNPGQRGPAQPSGTGDAEP